MYTALWHACIYIYTEKCAKNTKSSKYIHGINNNDTAITNEKKIYKQRSASSNRSSKKKHICPLRADEQTTQNSTFVYSALIFKWKQIQIQMRKSEIHKTQIKQQWKIVYTYTHTHEQRLINKQIRRRITKKRVYDWNMCKSILKPNRTNPVKNLDKKESGTWSVLSDDPQHNHHHRHVNLD